MSKKLICSLSALCISAGMFVSASAGTELTEGDYTYTVINDEAVIENFNAETEGDVVIPSQLGGYPVTGIADHAFLECNMESVTIPATVTSIGEYAFRYSKNLTAINVNSENPSYSSGSGVLFNKDKTELIKYPEGKTLGKFVIPNTVTTISESALEECTFMSVTIPNSVTEISAYAFLNCGSLTSITVPNSVISIGNDVFNNCDKLSQVKIGTGVTSIGEGAFENCDSLTSITIPDNVTSLGNSAFSSCLALTEVKIGSGLAEISPYTFSNCQNLTDITISDGVSVIGEYVFNRCYALTEITLPDSIKAINDSAFYYCYDLAKITLPDSLTDIGASAFYNTELSEVTIPAGVINIGDSAFGACNNLEKFISNNMNYCAVDGILFSKDMTELVSYVKHSGTDTYTIPDGVKVIRGGAFRGHDYLTEIIIPEGVTEIGDCAFTTCSKLKSVILPDTLETIGRSAFSSCSSLEKITIPDSVTSIDTSAFSHNSSLNEVIIGNGLETINNFTFSDCKNLKTVTIGKSVRIIGISAFDGCNSITDVYFAGTQESYDGILYFTGNKTLLEANRHYADPQPDAEIAFTVTQNEDDSVSVETENGENTENGKIILALYDADGRLKETHTATFMTQVSFDNVDLADNKVKVMLWKDMLPIAYASEMK